MQLYNPKKELLLKFSYLGFLLIAAIFTLGFPPYTFSYYQLGLIFGTLSLSCLSLQLFLGARVKLLEKGVGLPKILRWHSINGRLTLLFILLHPTLIFGPPLFSGAKLMDILNSLTLFHWLGIFAFLLIIFTITVTIYQGKIKLNYEYWKVIHKVGYLIIVLGFTHSFFVGPDISSDRPLYYWWMILALIAGFSFVYRYVLRKWFFKANLYEITKIVKESTDVRSIYFKPTKGKIFPYFPGQFAFVKFYSKSLSKEEHHFTISSSPSDSSLSLTVKESGDFTSKLDKLSIGDKSMIEGPFGAFSNAYMSGPFVFVAGGIGITPIISMLRFMKKLKQKEKTILIYGDQQRKDLIFYNELEQLKKTGNWLKAIYVLSKENLRKDGFYNGRINLGILQNAVLNFKSSKFFLVGPYDMIGEVYKILKTQGVEKQRIFTEKFALK